MSRRRPSRTTRVRPIIFVGGTAAALAASIAAAVRRRRAQADARPGNADFNCECGQAYRVVGEGRHRVFWLPDAAEDDPVLEDACPQCERRLSTQA